MKGNRNEKKKLDVCKIVNRENCWSVSESRPPRKEYSKLSGEDTTDKNDNETRCSHDEDHQDTRPTADLIDTDTSDSSCENDYDGHGYSDDSDYGKETTSTKVILFNHQMHLLRGRAVLLRLPRCKLNK